MADSGSPEYKRACQEETYYSRLRIQWTVPNMIDLTVSDSYQIHLDDRRKSILELTSDDCRSFCWKDCIIYGNVPVKPFAAYDMFRAVYREWYPYRHMGQDISLGSFFAQYLQLATPKPLSDVIQFHNMLCEHITRLQSSIKRPSTLHPGQPDYREPGFQEDPPYRLRPTFPVVFIVVDSDDWKNAGVLVVCKNRSTAAALGFSNEISALSASTPQGTSCMFRVALETVMYHIVAQDHARMSTRRESGEFFHEEFGGGDPQYTDK
ncbi:hypothetical protein MMC13_007968 [Lambiella insularis]|nr:hypothetical protein [Lambiella insularis]